MTTRLSKFQRLCAAHALTEDRFCIALHEMESDDPFSIVLEYDGSFPQPWTRVEMRRNISSVVAAPDDMAADVICVAVSDEGDVYFLEITGLKSEKIPGAGLYSDDAQGLGAINGLALINNSLHAFGLGGQLYSRESQGKWHRLSIQGNRFRLTRWSGG
jgi:hypothetical protein